MFDKWFKPKPKLHPISIAIKTIEVDRFKNIFSSDYSIFKISTYCLSIELYNLLLTKLITAISGNDLLYVSKLPQGINNIYLRDWFIDTNKRYLDPVLTVSEFLKLAEKFLILYKETEAVKNKDFVMEKNLLLSQQYFQNVSILLQELSGV